MYTILDGYAIDEVRRDLSEEGKEILRNARKTLKSDARPAAYGACEQADGSWRISIPLGLRRIRMGYDINDGQKLITLNYLKWDKFREALDWTMELLAAEPGKKK